MIRRLIILLLIVGCEANKGSKPNSSETQLSYKEKLEKTFKSPSELALDYLYEKKNLRGGFSYPI